MGNNTTVYIKEIRRECLDSIQLAQVRVKWRYSCDKYNELSLSINCGEFLTA
jgi:hypothetical protein